MEAILNRRSVRVYKKQEVEKEKIERIIKAGMQAPSAHNFQPWQFIVVRDEKKRKEISDLSIYGKPAKNCDTCIVLLADMDKVDKESHWWQQDMAACTENMLIQVVEENLGAVWLGYYPEEDRVDGVKKLFNLPDNLVAFAVIAIGYPEDNQGNKFVDRYDSEKVHYEEYK